MHKKQKTKSLKYAAHHVLMKIGKIDTLVREFIYILPYENEWNKTGIVPKVHYKMN